MLEIVNRLPARSFREIDNFLSFIGIYEDRQRTAALRALITRNRAAIAGKVGVEAGAGLGVLTRALLAAGAKRVYAVEGNAQCAQFLRQRFAAEPRVEVVGEPIERFRPPGGKVDFLFHELYGALLLDESILALERIRFDPGAVFPNGGRLLAQVVPLSRFKDPTITPALLRPLRQALVTDLFANFRFTAPRVAAEWRFKRGARGYVFACRLPACPDGVLALGMQVRHAGHMVTGTQECFNWPYVFTPAAGTKFRLAFSYCRGMTEVDFGFRAP